MVDKKLFVQMRQYHADRQRARSIGKLFLVAGVLLAATMLFTGCSVKRADAVARFLFYPKAPCDAYIEETGSCVQVANGGLYNDSPTK